MENWHEQGSNIPRAKPSLTAPSLGSSTRSKRHTLQASNAAMKFHGGAWRQTESPTAMSDPAARPAPPSNASFGKPGSAQHPAAASSPAITPEPGEKRPRSVGAAAHPAVSHGPAARSSPEDSQDDEDTFDLAEPNDVHSDEARAPSAAGHAHAATSEAAGMDVHARTQEALDALQRKEEQKLQGTCCCALVTGCLTRSPSHTPTVIRPGDATSQLCVSSTMLTVTTCKLNLLLPASVCKKCWA